jgi:hypothetical protein
MLAFLMSSYALNPPELAGISASSLSEPELSELLLSESAAIGCGAGEAAAGEDAAGSAGEAAAGEEAAGSAGVTVVRCRKAAPAIRVSSVAFAWQSAEASAEPSVALLIRTSKRF